jgi:nicotinate-nucleotide adenylyltransferase
MSEKRSSPEESAEEKITRSPLTLGVFGGTFDPIHNGHLIIAQFLLEELQFTRILFLVSARPPHKQPGDVTPWKDRLEMTRLALQGNSHFEISDLEIKRDGPSYTAETLDELQTQFGAQYRIQFIVGADSILEILSWRHPELLLESGSLVVAPRPGFDLDRLDRHIVEKVTIVHTPLLEISSSNIRRRVRERRPIRYLVPREVEDYIRLNNLYRPS